LKKQLAILGSTGSIGTQALEVVKSHSDFFSVEVLTAQNNRQLLIKQAVEFQPNAVVIGNEKGYREIKERLAHFPIKVFAGQDALAQIVEMEGIDMVLNCLVGFAGMLPTFNSVKNGKPVALANKESLVVAGDLIMKQARMKECRVIPVDSEHSAIFQCLAGEETGSIEKICLTASGGPFRGMTKELLKQVTRERALQHPNWNMGNKITIDSATLMNKGLEVIEAHWLFNLPPEQIEVIVHPQSVIHSMVRFVDGSVKAQLGVPDMRLPILYALAFPHRLSTDLPRLDFAEYPNLTFEFPDKEVFKSLSLAYHALESGGLAPCALNAANEVAVDAFLKGELSFLGIPRLIEECLDNMRNSTEPSLTDYVEMHSLTIQKAKKILETSDPWKF